MDVGANIPVGPGHLDLSAMRSINPMPGRGHMQGVRANYSIPFAAGGYIPHMSGAGGGVPPLEHGMAPQQAHVIDPGMRPPGAPIQHFGTGSAVKKVLEHARTVPFVHFSNHPNISRLEPSAYGSGIKGKEAARLKDAPDIKPRSYFYVKGDNVRPEQGLGAHQYEGVAENIYPLHEDPAGFSAKAREMAKDPYFAKMGVDIVDQPTHLNELERQIKNAGYSGYADDNVGLLFNPTDVTKVTD
jgi:hypothetical protein